MKYCIPDELFNRIEYPALDTQEVPIDGILREIYYKLPGADPVAVKKETWHTLCDFCSRLGALLMRADNDNGRQVRLSLQSNGFVCKFLWIVGAKANGVPTVDFEIVSDGGTGLVVNFPESVESCEVVYAVRPAFDYEPEDDNSASREWAPSIPQYFVDRYGECVAHGALARLYAMRGDAGMARMHATAYNNDLNRFAFGLVTAGMRKHLLIDVEDWLVNTNGNS